MEATGRLLGNTAVWDGRGMADGGVRLWGRHRNDWGAGGQGCEGKQHHEAATRGDQWGNRAARGGQSVTEEKERCQGREGHREVPGERRGGDKTGGEER